MQSDARSRLEAQFLRALTAQSAALNRLAASYTRSAADRDDLVQDIALAFWLALPAFRGECSERTFLFRIAHNRCIRHLSRRRNFVSVEAEEADLKDPAPSAETALSDEQERERLLRTVRRLPMIYREALILSLEGLEYAEIAEVLGINTTNVGVRLNRARQLVRRQLASS